MIDSISQSKKNSKTISLKGFPVQNRPQNFGFFLITSIPSNRRCYHSRPTDLYTYVSISRLLDIIPVGHVMHGLAAAEYNSINQNTTKVLANLTYQSLDFQSPRNVSISPKLFLDKVQVNDMYGNR